MMKPVAPACERNRDPILDELKVLLAEHERVLEIGSGTGQHAIYFAEALPHLHWYTSDLADCHDGINAWVDEASLDNVHPPFAFDMLEHDWPELEIDAVFSANTLHIMSWPAVEEFIRLCGRNLPELGRVIVYGPFNINGEYTSRSNEEFDQWLKSRDPKSGIRDLVIINQLAAEMGLELIKDSPMPANNRLVCWQKKKRPEKQT